MTTTPPQLPPAPPMLTPSQIADLAAAQQRMKGIRRAILTGQIDGGSLAVFGGLTLICGLFSVSGIVVGLGLAGVATVELWAVGKLKRLDERAPRILGFNQLALAGILILYAAWCLMFPSGLSGEIQSQLADLKSAGIDVETMTRQINLVVYSALIAVAILAQGSLALFYFRRVKMVRTFLKETPPWIVQMQRAGFGV